MEQKPLKEILREEMHARNYTIGKLARETAVPERYLDAIFEGRTDSLPPAPYVRGYLIKIAPLLGLDGGNLWNIFMRESAPKSSGPLDRMPANRFAIERVGKKWIVLGAIIFLLIAYFGINANRLLGKPDLSITNPSVETLVTTTDTITLMGRTDAENEVTVGGEQVNVDPTGKFEKEYTLQKGVNVIEIIAKKFLGRETKIIKQVIYQPAETLNEKSN